MQCALYCCDAYVLLSCFLSTCMQHYSYQSMSLQWKVGTSSLSSITTTSRGTGMETIKLSIIVFMHACSLNHLYISEDSLVILSQLLPNTTTITQRLDLLMRAVQQQLNTTQGITDTFLQV